MTSDPKPTRLPPFTAPPLIALSIDVILECYAGPTVSPGRSQSAQRESRAGATLSRLREHVEEFGEPQSVFERRLTL
jgi:hypothetical protein